MKLAEPFRRTPVILQSTAHECGLASLAMVCAFHGRAVDLAELRAELGMGRGARLADLAVAAEQLRLTGRALRLETCGAQQAAPTGNLALGPRTLCRARPCGAALGGARSGSWPAGCLVVRSIGAVHRCRLRGVAVGRVRGRGEQHRVCGCAHCSPSLATGVRLQPVIALSVLCQGAMLAAPVHLQVVVDQALVRGDANLIGALGWGFALVVVVRVLAEVLRGWVMVGMSATLAFQFGSGLFQRMLALPHRWFETRGVGDVVSRFHGQRPLREFATEALPQVAVDLVMVFGACGLMIAYSVELAALVLGAALLGGGVQLAVVARLRRYQQRKGWLAKPVKTRVLSRPCVAHGRCVFYGLGRERLRVWQAHLANTLRAGARGGRLAASAGAARHRNWGFRAGAAGYARGAARCSMAG